MWIESDRCYSLIVVVMCIYIFQKFSSSIFVRFHLFFKRFSAFFIFDLRTLLSLCVYIFASLSALECHVWEGGSSQQAMVGALVRRKTSRPYHEQGMEHKAHAQGR